MSEMDEIRKEYVKPNPVKATDIFPELMAEIDNRIALGIATAISSMKVWILTGLVVYIVAGVAGVTTLVFHMGQLHTQFTESLERDRAQTQALLNRHQWIQRKDALDDDMIRYLSAQGYMPPDWYQGRDADHTGT